MKRRRLSGSGPEHGKRYYGSGKGTSTQLREELAREHVKDLSNQQKAKKEARALDKVQSP